MAADCEINFEKEFSPSMWSKRFSNREDVLKHHVKHAENESKDVLTRLNYKLDIPYGDSENQKLDILGTDLPSDCPILVFIHGGYWQELSRPQSRYPAGPLHSAGIKTVIIGYDLCPKVTLFDIVKQIEKATKFVIDYATNANSKGVYFAGHSAGAHLIASILSDAKFLESIPNIRLLQGAILVSGIYDLTSLTNTSVNDSLNLTQEQVKQLSPHFENFFHLQNYAIRVYILAGENDSFTFKKQSMDFYNMLMECCDVENINFEIRDNMDHFDIMETITEENNYFKNILLNDINKYLNK